MKRIISAMLVLSVLVVSCKKDNEKDGFFKGPEVAVHHGKAWTWVKLDNHGNPEQVSVTINDAAMNSLPAGDGSGGHNMMDNNFVLPLNPKVKNTIFDHVWLNWNPNGHEPPGIYDLPHFDLHFYTVPHSEVMNSVDPVKMDNKPSTDYFPTNYFVPGPGVPQMGLHWLDMTSPELNGQKFTQTFILGSYDGKVTFYEPMITKEFLTNTTNYERSIPQAIKFQKTGYYPTKMRVIKHDGLTEIILDGFRSRQAS